MAMNCSNCGAPVNEGQKFCSSCGSNTTFSEQSNTEVTNPAEHTSSTMSEESVSKESNSGCNWIYLVIGLCLFFGYKTCSSDSSSDSSNSVELSEETEVPDWIPGAWSAENTPVGTISAIFTSTGIYKDNIDNKSGTYRYDPDEKRIHTSTGTVYEVDFSNRRLGVGYGVWMYKK